MAPAVTGWTVCRFHEVVGVIEAKPKNWGHKITTVEEQSAGYAAAKLKWVNNNEPLPYIYESTGVITRFTNGRDPRPRSREVFTFPLSPVTMTANIAVDSAFSIARPPR
jgi:type I site-specific restriction endonuclease